MKSQRKISCVHQQDVESGSAYSDLKEQDLDPEKIVGEIVPTSKGA